MTLVSGPGLYTNQLPINLHPTPVTLRVCAKIALLDSPKFGIIRAVQIVLMFMQHFRAS